MFIHVRAVIVAVFAVAAVSAHAACELPWLFLDLGDTIVDTHGNFKKVNYMPGAHAYLQDLRDKGYHVGLIVNIPEEWGKTQEEKLKTTQAFIAAAWADPTAMDWSQFDLGVAFPPTNAQRKPAPFLFVQAMMRAKAAGCDVVYQTNSSDEVPPANAAGMVGIPLGFGQYDGGFYYPEKRLRKRDFSIVRPVLF